MNERFIAAAIAAGPPDTRSLEGVFTVYLEFSPPLDDGLWRICLGREEIEPQRQPRQYYEFVRIECGGIWAAERLSRRSDWPATVSRVARAVMRMGEERGT